MRKTLLSVLILLGVAACGGATNGTSTAIPAAITPWASATPVSTITPLPPLTEVFLPSPTPVTYSVKSGDTMSGIALKYNLTLAALQAANPGVDPTILSIGTVLIIPVGGTVMGEPTPTPAALPVRQAHCWSESTGGLWCFGLVQNEFGTTMENLSAQITLLDASGSVIAQQTVFGMLDILPPGMAMPFMAHFPAPMAEGLTPRVQVLTAILLLPDDTRYIPVSLQNLLTEVNGSGRTAQVSGQVTAVQPDAQVNSLWILGVAYDSVGNVVGARRWEAFAPLAGGASQPFSFMVSSVGPAIERVELIAEARP